MNVKRLIYLLAWLCIGSAIGLGIKTHLVMKAYPGYWELFKQARHSALPYFVIAIILLVIAYLLTIYIRFKRWL